MGRGLVSTAADAAGVKFPCAASFGTLCGRAPVRGRGLRDVPEIRKWRNSE